MFGLKKEIRQLKEMLQSIMRQSEDEKQKQLKEVSDGLKTMTDGITAVNEAIGKHDMTIEDMLDEWEEIQAANRQEKENLQVRLIEKQKAELDELSGRAKELIEMTVQAWDQVYLLLQAAQKAKDESWIQQLTLAENQIREKALHAGLQRTGTPGEPFSYEMHEPMLRVDTDKPELDMTVAEVYTPGYWYRGKAFRKAKVEVYRLKEEEPET